MRNWTLTVLGALLAMLLWRAARIFEPFTTEELKTYSGQLALLRQQVKAAGKKLTEEENETLMGFMRNDNLKEGLDYIDTLRGKYLGSEPSSEDRLDILTNLIDDARRRIAAIEKKSTDAKEKGDQAQAQINALSNQSTLPPVDLNAKPVA